MNCIEKTATFNQRIHGPRCGLRCKKLSRYGSRRKTYAPDNLEDDQMFNFEPVPGKTETFNDIEMTPGYLWGDQVARITLVSNKGLPSSTSVFLPRYAMGKLYKTGWKKEEENDENG